MILRRSSTKCCLFSLLLALSACGSGDVSLTTDAGESVASDSASFEGAGFATEALSEVLGPPRLDDEIGVTQFYLATEQETARFSGNEDAPIFYVVVGEYAADDGSTPVSITFNNWGQCGGLSGGMMVDLDETTSDFLHGVYPVVDGLGFDVVDTLECVPQGPPISAELFAEPFSLTDISENGFTLVTPDGEEHLFLNWGVPPWESPTSAPTPEDPVAS